MRVTFEKCTQLLNDAKNIALFCHIRPDGDTLGAALGLKFAFKKVEKNVDIYCESDIPEKFKKFGFAGNFNTQLLKKPEEYDLLVAIDCGDLGRVGVFGYLFNDRKNTLTIDHHTGHDDFGKYTYVESCSSTCEIILDVINALKIELDNMTATYLFVGLSTDTGNFKHSSTNEKTFRAAEQLIAQKVDIAEINRKFYNENTFERLKLLGRSLSGMRRYYDGKLCIMYVTEKDFADCGATMECTEGFTDYAISVDTAQIGVCISQNNANSFKVSMRSKSVDVSEICRYFGGGGHRQASGCVICGFLEDIIDKIVRVVEDVKWTDS